MTETIRYGQIVSVDIPDDSEGRKSILFQPGTASGIVGSQQQAGQSRWIIVSGGNQAEGDPVRFAHLILLKSADNPGYLNWSRDTFTCSVTSTPDSMWAIHSPDGSAKDDEIKAGDEFALGSMIGPYIGRGAALTDPIKLGGASNLSIIWTFHHAGAPTRLGIRYGNAISISRATGATQVNRLAAVSTYVKGDPNQDPNDNTRAVTLDSSAAADPSRWTILNPDNLSSTARARFGDIVCLSASRLRDNTRPSPASYYLSYRNDHLTSDGHRKIGVVEAIGAWERWRIVDPAQPMSVEYGGENIKFEDTFALKSESGNGEYLCRLDAGGVSSCPTLADAAKWTAANVFTFVDAKMPDPLKLPQSSDNSAARLSFGSDIDKTIAKGIAGGLGKGVGLILPAAGAMAGTALEGLVGLLWPSGGSIDIWSLIKSHVEALVNEKIQDDRINTFANKLNGIKNLLDRYRDMRTKGRRGAALEDIIAIVTSEEAQGIKLGDAQRVLPYQVMLGTLHISALHETFLYGPQYWEDYRDAEMDRAALKTKIEEYSTLIAETKRKALEWRRGLITGSDAITENNSDRGNRSWLRKKIVDRFIQSNGHLAYWDYDFDAAFARYQDRVVDIFSQQLDDFMQPALLWRYMDPDCDEVPMKRPGATVTGPFGLFGDAEGDTGWPHYYGDVFFYDPQSGPITEIAMCAGDLVYGIKVSSSGRGDWHGSSEENMKLAVDADMKITEVSGVAGWSINNLRFVTDKTRRIFSTTTGALEGGRLKEGNKFLAQPPSNADAFLTGISGNAKDALDTIYFHWQYSRWE